MFLISEQITFRQNEIQRLKESLILQNQKRDDLKKYKNNGQTEYQENTVSYYNFNFEIANLALYAKVYNIILK